MTSRRRTTQKRDYFLQKIIIFFFVRKTFLLLSSNDRLRVKYRHIQTISDFQLRLSRLQGTIIIKCTCCVVILLNFKEYHFMAVQKGFWTDLKIFDNRIYKTTRQRCWIISQKRLKRNSNLAFLLSQILNNSSLYALHDRHISYKIQPLYIVILTATWCEPRCSNN